MILSALGIIICVMSARAMFLPRVRQWRPFVYLFLGLGVVCGVVGVRAISDEMRDSAAHDTWVYGSIVVVALVYLATWIGAGIILERLAAQEREAVRTLNDRANN